ncbi:polyisoprenoid-binding protein [Iodidimonas nitroreducens]|uniref:Polyisoprenoid-binding protein n=1 Tax=Iodidimonas nitroreducens TaxID=1236968 RepID=A0A5A7N4L1_9PROT|nr:YceI family protein [Iodidimonas nitroreducens]GAK32385.1 hypothetical protein AQ1_00249 [alpha proteobacterium Q-1]GER03181.1 polyisoprenoid-binding protein [Iodidimonas nitroreducens]
MQPDRFHPAALASYSIHKWPATPSVTRTRPAGIRLALAFILTFTVLVLLSGCTKIEQGIAVLSHDVTTRLSKAPAGIYRADPDHVSVQFSLNHLGYSQFTGRFDTIDISLDLKPDDPLQSKMDVRIPLQSVNSGSSTIDDILRTDLFDLARYPEIHFTAESIRSQNGVDGTIEGQLEMNGRRRPIRLEVTFNGYAKNPLTGAPTLGFSARTHLDRSAFGLGKWSPAVGHEVAIMIEAELIHQP